MFVPVKKKSQALSALMLPYAQRLVSTVLTVADPSTPYTRKCLALFLPSLSRVYCVGMHDHSHEASECSLHLV